MKLIMNLMNAMNWKDTNKCRRGRKKLFCQGTTGGGGGNGGKLSHSRASP
jgi:hypothetical protein